MDGYSFQIGLPLKDSVIFVDWHGVLSDQLFWHTLLSNPSHPLYLRLQRATEQLFGSERDLVQAWMRGALGSVEIIEEFRLTLPKNYRSDYLHRRLMHECQRISPNSPLLETLQHYVNRSWLVLATDNMDCFSESLPSIPAIATTFDHVLCSSDMGVLKTDGVLAFFGPWLAAHELAFSQAVLIDDSPSTCDEFRRAGGTAICYEDVYRTQQELRDIEKSLIGRSIQGDP